jgi:hypothetical protein
MSVEHLQEIAADELMLKRFVKAMVLQCFRDTEALENLHAGRYPSSKAGDYSDVKVVSPFGEIPWERLSRFSDDEMRVLMIEVVDRCYGFLEAVLSSPEAGTLVAELKKHDPCPQWKEPSMQRLFARHLRKAPEESNA